MDGPGFSDKNHQPTWTELVCVHAAAQLHAREHAMHETECGKELLEKSAVWWSFRGS